MLVLSRRRNESIIILTPKNEILKIGVAKIEANQVKIFIEVDKSFKILREEIYIEQKNINNTR